MKKILSIIAVTVWAIAIVIGTVWITDYATRPGQKGVSPSKLSFGSSGETQADLPKLFVFLHPHCPCSRATLKELNDLLERNSEMMEVTVFFYQPSDQPENWSETELWQIAEKIPNVNLAKISLEDLQKFGAITSGQTLLYDTEGNLVFSGGITQSRGHEGTNAGIEMIERFLHGIKPEMPETPVFGCILTTSG